MIITEARKGFRFFCIQAKILFSIYFWKFYLMVKKIINMPSILSGLTKETYQKFSQRDDNSGKLSFVRNPDKNRGMIYFGNQQYGIADFETTDANLLLDYTETGLDVNYNLAYDYEFEASRNTNGNFEKLLLLPDGTYTFFVERWANGHTQNGYATISVDNRGLGHSEFAINSEILWFVVQGQYSYYLCIPTESIYGPRIIYRLKLMGSSRAKKKDIIDVHGSYIDTSKYGQGVPEIIPCITNKSSVININSADVLTTYCTTATPVQVSEEIVGRAYIVTNSNLQNYIINTDDVDDSDRISAVVLSNSADTASTTVLNNGIYRFKFTDGIDNGIIVSCDGKYYEYTGSVIENAILSLTVNDNYSEWSISYPTVYSSDKSVKVVADNTGGYDVTVPAIEIGNQNLLALSGKVDSISGTYLSGVTINGSNENVTITDNVADLQMLFSNAGFYNNALVCAYYGSRDHNYGNWVQPLFTARVQDNNSFKFSIRFRLCATSSYHRSWQSEYYFDAHNVDNDNPYQTLACLDFHSTDFGISPTSYGPDSNNMASLYDVFYTTEKTFNEKGIEEWIVKFYKLHLSGFDMFAMLVDWVMDGNIQVDFHSMGYRNINTECISGSILGLTWKDDDERTANFDSPVQYTHSLSVAGTFESVIGDKKVYRPVDYREGSANVVYSGLNTTNKTVVGAINELMNGGGGGSGSGLTGVTINKSTDGVSIEDKIADLTIKDWTEEINFLSGRVDILINSLQTTPSEGGGGGGGGGGGSKAVWEEISAITAQILTIQLQLQDMKQGATAVTYSDGAVSHTGYIDENLHIDLGTIETKDTESLTAQQKHNLDAIFPKT